MEEVITLNGSTVAATEDNDFFTIDADNVTLTVGGGLDILRIAGDGNIVTIAGGRQSFYIIGDNNSIGSDVDDEDAFTFLWTSGTGNSLKAGDVRVTGMLFSNNNYVESGNRYNDIVSVARNNTIVAGDGGNRIYFNGSGLMLSLGDGPNSVYGFDAESDPDDVELATMFGAEAYAENSDNVVVTGDGNDYITVRTGNSYIDAGDGNDTIYVSGDGNIINAGYIFDPEDPDTISDDDMITVAGVNNTIYTGAGANYVEVSGEGNIIISEGENDTILATVDSGSFTTDDDAIVNNLKINWLGDNNEITVSAGELVINGDYNLLELNGVNATVVGNSNSFNVDNGTASIGGEELNIGAGNATLTLDSTTGGLLTIVDNAVVNGRSLKSNDPVLMTLNGGAIALASVVANGETPSTVEGFGDTPIIVTDSLTADGVNYKVNEVASEIVVDRQIILAGHVITGLDDGENLQISEAGTYTVNGYAIEATPNDTITGAADWAALLKQNTVDNVLFEGRDHNDEMENYGANVTIDGKLGEDYVSMGSAAREFIVFGENYSLEAEGFATGFDSVSDVILGTGHPNEYSVDFGISGVHLYNGDGELDLVNSGFDTVNFLLQFEDTEPFKITAINSTVSAGVTGADFYVLSEHASLVVSGEDVTVNGIAFDIDQYDIYDINTWTISAGVTDNDYEFANLAVAFGVENATAAAYETDYTIHGVFADAVINTVEGLGDAYYFDGAATVNDMTGAGIFNGLMVQTDGHVTIEVEANADVNDQYNSIKSLTGLAAGNGVTISSIINGGYIGDAYTVNADGTEISRVDGTTTTVVWAGDDASTVDMMVVYASDVFEDRVQSVLYSYITQYISLSGTTLTIDAAGLRNEITLLLERANARISEVENPTVDDVINVVNNYLGDRFGLDIYEIFTEDTIENLKERLTADIAAGRDIFSEYFSEIDSNGIVSFVNNYIVNPLIEVLGEQTTAQEITSVVSSRSSILESFIFDTLLPQVFNNEKTLSVARRVFENYKYETAARIQAVTGATDHIDVVIKGTNDTLGIGAYFNTGAATIDASNNQYGGRILNAFDSTATVGADMAIFGTAQRDVIFASAGNTIDSGAGEGDKIVLAGGDATVYINDTLSATVSGIVGAFESFVDSVVYNDTHTREYVGISTLSSVNVYGFESGWSVNGGATDVVYLVDGNVDDLRVEINSNNDVDVINRGGTMKLISKSSIEGSDIDSTTNSPNTQVGVNLMLSDNGELIRATAINSGYIVAATGADHYYIGDAAAVSGFTGSAIIDDIRLQTNGSLNIYGATVAGTDGYADNAVAEITGLAPNNTLSISETDGSDEINYSVSGDGTSIVRLDKNQVVWSGAASELSSLNMFAVDDRQIQFDGIETSLSTALNRDINLIVSVVDGESIVGTSNNDVIFAGPNDSVGASGGNDLIFFGATTLAAATLLNEYVDNGHNRQYVDLSTVSSATVVGFDIGTLSSSDVVRVIDGGDVSISTTRGGLRINDGAGSLVLSGVSLDGELLLTGGSGDTLLIANNDNNTSVIGSNGLDMIYNTGSNVTIDGNGGADLISLEGSSQTVVMNNGITFVEGYKTGDSVRLATGTLGNTTLNVYDGAAVLTDGDASMVLVGAMNETVSIVDVNGAVQTLTAADQSIRNTVSSVSINGSLGDDTLVNTGANVTIDGGTGADYISLSGSNQTVIFQDGATIDGFKAYSPATASDAIYLESGSAADISLKVVDDGFIATMSGASMFIKGATAGNALSFVDSVSSDWLVSSDDVTSINNTLSSAFVMGTKYNTTITNTGANVTILGDAANDSITNSGTGGLIVALSGNDTIINSGSNLSINASAGNDVISNTAANVIIFGDTGNDTITSSGSNVTILGGEGDDDITNSGPNGLILSVEGNDNITNNGANSTVGAGDGNDTVTNTAANVSITGGAGDDVIVNSGANAKIDGGDGNDRINNSASGVSITGGAGDDAIVSSGANSYIDGGAGANTITASGTRTTVHSGAGNDLISGLKSGDVVQFDSSASMSYNNGNIVIGNSTLRSTNDFEGVSIVSGNSTLNAGAYVYNASMSAGGAYFDNSANNVDVTLSNQTAIIGKDATGAKVLTATKAGSTLENYSSAAFVMMNGSARNDYILLEGGEQVVDVSRSRNDTIDVRSGTVNVSNYNAGLGTTFVSDVSPSLAAEGMFGDDWTVTFDGDTSNGVFANIQEPNGVKQLYGWGDVNSMVDGSSVKGAQVLISAGGNSTLRGGDGNDTIDAVGGDLIMMSHGRDSIAIDHESSKDAATIAFSGQWSNSTVTGYDGDIVQIANFDDLKVFQPKNGTLLMEGNTKLLLEGVTNNITLTDGKETYTLRTDYQASITSAQYVFEDEDGVIRTPKGDLVIEDGSYKFLGGGKSTVKGFDFSTSLEVDAEVESVAILTNGAARIHTKDGGMIQIADAANETLNVSTTLWGGGEVAVHFDGLKVLFGEEAVDTVTGADENTDEIAALMDLGDNDSSAADYLTFDSGTSLERMLTQSSNAGNGVIQRKNNR